MIGLLHSFLYWSIRPVIGIFLITGLLIFWLIKGTAPSLKAIRAFIFLCLITIFSRSFLMTFLNIYLWSKDELAKRLLPPYAPWSYAAQYSFYHYWFEPMVLIIFALIIFWAIILLNKKFQNKLFYDEEPYFALLGVLLTGWPNCLVYLILVLSLGLASHIFLYIFSKERELPLLYFWLPCALLVIIANDIISKYSGVAQFTI